MLDTIFFDATFTLIAPEPSVGDIYARYAKAHGTDVSAEGMNRAFFEAFRQEKAAGVALPYGTTEEEGRAYWSVLVDKVFALAGSQTPAAPFFDEVFEAFARAESWKLYEDARPALAYVRERGVRTGLMTNFDPRIRRLMGSLGIQELLDFIVLSCDAGAEKPDPAIFHLAQERAGDPPPEQLALIGDSLREDYQGAVGSGWKAVLLRRSAEQGAVGAAVPVFPDLLSAVKHLLP